MIISVEKLKEYITTDLSDSVLEAKLQALELLIRKKTNNNFQNKNKRFYSGIENGNLTGTSPYIKAGDTIQISESKLNEGIYVLSDSMELIDESQVLVTKIEYPMDVVMGVVEILKWKLKNEAANSGDTSKKDIQSETISRHSVTYAQDATESDIDNEMGVPKKYLSFLKAYKKARF